MTKTERNDGRVELLAAEGCFLRRKGSSEDCRDNRRLTVPADRVAEWEEVAIGSLPAYTEAEYEERVTELIRERYSVSAELAVLRQRDSKPEEFAEYDAYAEECKARARMELTDVGPEEDNGHESD
jgi:hypothetical protein